VAKLKSSLRAATKEATEIRVPSGQVEVITPSCYQGSYRNKSS